MFDLLADAQKCHTGGVPLGDKSVRRFLRAHSCGPERRSCGRNAESTLGRAGGPADDSPFVVEFREHVTALRDTLWERYLAPIGELIAKQRPTGTPMPPPAEPSDRLIVEQTLWARSNGTGMS